MAFSQEDLTKLDKALRGGALRTQYGDRRTTMRPLDEIMAIRNLVEQDVNPARRGPIRKVMAHSKGVNAGGLGSNFLGRG